MKKRLAFVIVCICLTLSRYNTHAQISPGKLVSAHSKLEGLSNCTACHELGKKVISEKCLDCHKEIKNLISQKKGYHSSTEVTGKDCFSCHSDHHGLKFQIIRFDTIHFNHQMAGYELKASGNVGSQRAVSVINEYTAHTRGHVIVGADDSAGGGDYHVEAIGVGLEAFMFGEMLGKAVG